MGTEIATNLKYANLQMAAESLFGALATDAPGGVRYKRKTGKRGQVFNYHILFWLFAATIASIIWRIENGK